MKLVPIPQSHCDLTTLMTLMPNGQPQMTPVWCSREGDYILVNTMRGFQKEKQNAALSQPELIQGG